MLRIIARLFAFAFLATQIAEAELSDNTCKPGDDACVAELGDKVDLLQAKAIGKIMQASNETGVTCTCETPNQGTAGKNRYSCTDGSTSFCAPSEACAAKAPFPKGEHKSACTPGAIECLCTSPNAGTAGKNHYSCTDGSDAWCHHTSMCAATGPFEKTAAAAACKVMCTCDTPRQGFGGKNRYTCTDGSAAFCASNQMCHSSAPFPKWENRFGCAVMEPECSCSTPNAGFSGKNGYKCNDGSAAWCAPSDMCVATSPFKKSEVTTVGCKRMPVTCTCDTPNQGTAGKNRYTCNDGTSAYCGASQVCHTTQPFPQQTNSLGCKEGPPAPAPAPGGGGGWRICGNYCGPGWSCGQRRSEQSCDGSTPVASGLWGPDCTDICCKNHDMCCKQPAPQNKDCNRDLVNCLKGCSPLGVTCLSEVGLPVPPAAVWTAMSFVEDWCCGDRC